LFKKETYYSLFILLGSIYIAIGIHELISYRNYLWGSISLIIGIIIFILTDRFFKKWNNEEYKGLLKEELKYRNKKNIEMSRKIKARIMSRQQQINNGRDTVDAPRRVGVTTPTRGCERSEQFDAINKNKIVKR
jgi:hypothetical protein